MYILIYYIYIVAGLSMARVKIEEYKQIHQCFSNKNHIFSVDLVHIASFTQASHKFTTVHREAHGRSTPDRVHYREE